MRGDRAYLLDILDAIGDIEQACSKLSDAFRDRHTEIPWRAIIGMRHHLVHGYFDVDPDVVWSAIADRIPEFKAQVEAALAADGEVRDDG